MDHDLLTRVASLDLQKIVNTLRLSVCQLYTSYLSSRTHMTQVQGVMSSVKNIACGIPQGSIYVRCYRYISDLPDCLDQWRVSLCVDGTAMYFSS